MVLSIALPNGWSLVILERAVLAWLSLYDEAAFLLPANFKFENL